jgi:outer membrane biogenesis lipoprotein LolB
VALGLALFWLSGCARLVSPPRDQAQARAVVDHLTAANGDLAQFKGIGHLRLEAKGQVLSGRMAWAAAPPEKLRVEWLNMLGQPMTSLAGDGHHITIVSINDRKLHRLKQKEKALDDVIQVPMGIEDLIALIAGRPPLPGHAAAWLVLDRENTQFIELKDRWANTVASIQVDKPRRQPRAMTVYSGNGTMKYRIEWTRWQELDSRRLPRQILIEAGSGQRVHLNLERYWLDVALPLETFVLTAPDER